MKRLAQNGWADNELKPDALSRLKVFTVDDQPDLRELISLAFGRYGAEGKVSESAKPIELHKLATAIAPLSRRV